MYSRKWKFRNENPVYPMNVNGTRKLNSPMGTPPYAIPVPVPCTMFTSRGHEVAATSSYVRSYNVYMGSRLGSSSRNDKGIMVSARKDR